MTVAITIANRPVLTSPDSYTVASNSSLTIAAGDRGSNDSNPDNSHVTYAAVSQPQHGTLALAADGSFTYTPNANFSGYDHFSYKGIGKGVTTCSVEKPNEHDNGQHDVVGENLQQRLLTAGAIAAGGRRNCRGSA